MTTDAPRVICDRCHRTMPNLGYKRCVSCELGPSFSATSAGARAALEAHGKRKRLAVVRDGEISAEQAEMLRLAWNASRGIK